MKKNPFEVLPISEDVVVTQKSESEFLVSLIGLDSVECRVREVEAGRFQGFHNGAMSLLTTKDMAIKWSENIMRQIQSQK